MAKTKYSYIIRNLPGFILTILLTIFLIAHPTDASTGIKNGLFLLGEKIIPALFPFMILASYIASSPVTTKSALLLDKISLRAFGVNGNGIVVVFLGLLGGYPIGAKTLCKYYDENKLTINEVFKLFPWCVNPGPAFTITAVGTFMIGSTKAGIIMYLSAILSSFSIGLFSKFFVKTSYESNTQKTCNDSKCSFVECVASATSAMLSICSWVLIFSAINNCLHIFIKNETAIRFLSCISEVTTGCNTLLESNFPIPVICAIIQFGGLAVIFQIAPYLEKCGYKLRHFFCWRILNSALSSFYCSQLIKIFPITTEVCKTIHMGSVELNLSHNIAVTIILIITCIVFVLEVDYKKKIC